MKFIRKYNESFDAEDGDIQETIDSILDNLNSKGNLSESERDFMEEASKNQVVRITVPKSYGDIWSDMSNPHASMTLWLSSKTNTWKELKSLEEEESNNKFDDDVNGGEWDWKMKVTKNLKSLYDKNPELLSDLSEINNKMKELEKEKSKIISKYKNLDSNSKQLLEYGLKNSDSLEEKFGYWKDNKDGGKMVLGYDPKYLNPYKRKSK